MIADISALALSSFAIEVNDWSVIKEGACAITYDVCICIAGADGCSQAELVVNSSNAVQCEFDRNTSMQHNSSRHIQPYLLFRNPYSSFQFSIPNPERSR